MPTNRDAFDAAPIPQMRMRLAEVYREFREREAELISTMVPIAEGGTVGDYHTRDCPNCGDSSDRADRVLSVSGLNLICCRHCQTTYTREVMDEGADADRYQASLLDDITLKLRLSEPYLQLETARAQYYLDLVSRFGAIGDLLEIGSGYGTFLMEAQKVGWQALGLEPGRLAAQTAYRRGANVRRGYFPEDLPDRRSNYDVVAALDVLEHFARPLDFLAEIRAHLRPNGILFIQVPNWDSLLVQLEGAESSIITPGHWTYFTPATLQDMLQRANFRTLHVETVQSEIDRQEKFDRVSIQRALDRLRPGETGKPDAARLHELNLSYKLIGAFRRED